jgi:hypothetical protein
MKTLKKRSYLCGFLLVGILLGFGAAPSRADGLKQSVEMASGTLQSLPDATCNSTNSVIVPADTNQECAILVNFGANTARVGDSNCGASRCATIAAGGTVTICTEAAIYCYSGSGTTIAITKVQQ